MQIKKEIENLLLKKKTKFIYLDETLRQKDQVTS